MNPFSEHKNLFYENPTMPDIENFSQHEAFYNVSISSEVDKISFGAAEALSIDAFENDSVFNPVETSNIFETEALPEVSALSFKPSKVPLSIPEALSRAPTQTSLPKAKRRRSNRNFLQPVIRVLSEWYLHSQAGLDVDALTDFEAELISTILKRKLLTKVFSPNQSSREYLVENFGEVPRKSAKRTEENNKFIFKHAVKLMKLSFRAKHCPDAGIEEVDKRFYEHYFAESDIIEDSILFLSPSKKCKGSSLSLGIIRKIFRARKFREEFLTFLRTPSSQDNLLAKTYMAGIPKKLTKLFARWERRFNQDEEAAKEQIFNYFRYSNQCKFPWTSNEIQTAVESLISTAESVNTDWNLRPKEGH